MTKLKIINIVLIAAAVVLIGVFALSVRLEAAADSVVVLQTNGMTCASCSERIITALRPVHGVASAAVDLAAGQVVIGYDSKRVDAARLAEKVTASGYGSSIVRTMTREEYQAATGKNPGPVLASKGGCGSKCCKQPNQ